MDKSTSLQLPAYMHGLTSNKYTSCIGQRIRPVSRILRQHNFLPNTEGARRENFGFPESQISYFRHFEECSTRN